MEFKTHNLLRSFFNELLKFNKTVNLIPSKSLLHCDLIHFADCLRGSQIVQKKINENIGLYDVGSGGGFPGMVYAILFPTQKMTLVELDDRKAEFLSHVVKLLGLQNVSVENRKVESFGSGTLQQALCRGYGSLTQTLMTLRKPVVLGGIVFHFKSDEWSNEVLQIPSQLCSSWKPSMIGEYKLPLTDTKLYIVESIKI